MNGLVMWPLHYSWVQITRNMWGVLLIIMNKYFFYILARIGVIDRIFPTPKILFPSRSDLIF